MFTVVNQLRQWFISERHINHIGDKLKKRISLWISIIFFVVIFSGCGQRLEEDANTPKKQSAITMEFTLEGKQFILPCDYKEFAMVGYNFRMADYGYKKGYEMKKGDKTYITFDLVNEEGAVITVGFINNSNEVCDITHSQVWAIDVNCSETEVIPDIILPGEVTWTTTKSQLEDIYGRPESAEDILHDEDKNSYQYTYMDTYKKYTNIYMQDDQVMRIRLECYQ